MSKSTRGQIRQAKVYLYAEQYLISASNKLSKALKKASLVGASELEEAVTLLRLKAVTHANCALVQLHHSQSESDAIVLLRCAYEAYIVALYLENHPSMLSEYKAHARIVDFKNRLQMYEISKKLYIEPELMERERAAIETAKREIIRLGLMQTVKKPEEWLGDLDKLISNFSHAQFKSFWTLKGDCDFVGLDEIFESGFQLYSLGSQIAHSSFFYVKRSIGQNDRTFSNQYPESSIYRFILGFFLATVQRFAETGLIKSEHAADVEIYLFKAQKKLMSLD